MADIATITNSGSGSLVDYLTDKQDGTSVFDSSVTASSADKLLNDARAARQARNAYGSGGLSSSIGQAALKRALSEMETSDGRVTFADIAAYQKELEASFSAAVRLDLERLGVSSETEFTLNISAEGVISVNCDDQAAREKIEKYLSDNPDVRERFSYIQALANLDRAKQSPAAVRQDVKNATVRLQSNAIEVFFEAAVSSGMNFTGMLASFGSGGGSASYYTGVDYTV